MAADLTTVYMGLKLRNPLVIAACPLTGDLTMLRRLEDAGAAAAVLPSVFEEQIQHRNDQVYHLYDRDWEEACEPLGIIADLSDYNSGPDSYLRMIECAKRTVQIPIIASMNATRKGAWVRYAKLMAEAGADALELNICFIPTDPELSSQQLEDQYVELVAAVRAQISLPVAVKIGPFVSALPNLAGRFVAAGANGLVLFNRFLEPDIDIESRRIEPRLALSNGFELRLPLRWIAILRDQVAVSLAATSGIHAAVDAIKAILAGADVVMMASTLIRHGPNYLLTVHHDLVEWLEQNEVASLTQLRGTMSMGNLADPSALERANYLKMISTFPAEKVLANHTGRL
jgi:dihydroorotate dehydrogenase (fumarate)